MDNLRDKINGIDDQIVELFRERMETVEAIAEYKKAHGLDVYDPSREAALLARLAELAGDDLAEDIRRLYDTILKLSKERQRRILAK